MHQRHNNKLNALQNESSISGHSRQPYGNEKHMDSLGMSHNMMSNSSSNGESVGKQFVSSRVSQDIEYQKPFPLKEQYDSTSTENISGKLYSYNIILFDHYNKPDYSISQFYQILYVCSDKGSFSMF